MGDSSNRISNPGYESDEEKSIVDQMDGCSVVSYKSKYSNALKVGREELLSASRLLRSKKIKGEGSIRTANSKTRNFEKGNNPKKFL